MISNGNTPATPLIAADGRPYNFRKDLDGGYFSQEGQFFSIGFTKREELSARFMAAIIANPTTRMSLTDAELARIACEQADALLAEWAK
jgi:hypothetical protein